MMVLPWLPPELISPTVIVPPLASEDRRRRRCRPPRRHRCPGPTGATGRGVAVAAVGVGDRRAAVGADVDRRLVGDRAAVDRDVAALGALDHDRVARVAAGVDVADCDRAAIGIWPPRRRRCRPPLATVAVGPPAPPAAALPLPPLALATAVPPSALMAMVVVLRTVPPLMRTLEARPNKPPRPTTMVLPRLLPELMLPTVIVPPLACATATPPFPAAALPPLPTAPPAPPAAALPLPPLALLTAMPPSALRRSVVSLETVPPLIATLLGP